MSPLKPSRIALLLAALSVGVCSGCLDRVGPPSPPPSPAPTPSPLEPTHTDAEFWSALARRVAAGKIADTDELIALTKAAQDAGDLRDATPLATALPPDAAAKNTPLTPTNRDQIATAIRRL